MVGKALTFSNYLELTFILMTDNRILITDYHKYVNYLTILDIHTCHKNLDFS